ncbi:caspase family protein [Lusitaniella coriacea LEGE 07157]|uniref:Caspase family protein n=1 Tax=Lusitaniella coriacea LEGE 07157 TaxID=945747 RepID=A0A8J7DZ60_9CYAN|nr:caspase family protein [Lusitaniella coriacea]MBE9117766.1 caspase family protein [Lusitaniella coriacea LEGE 07157]
MSKVKRRQFLQFAGSALATIGLSQLELQRQGLRYRQVLAQNPSRKLALLVGINRYPESNRFGRLRGCVQDVELQKNLLIHRFGFNKNDIKTLTDAQASRKGILDAFEQHLIAQAQPGDVVVFHFSGHGSFVTDPSPIDPGNPFNSTFVPADDASPAGGVVKDIMGQTLFLLLYALRQKTENVTVVLDSCHSGGGTRGEILVRAGEPGRSASPEEFEYQEQWLTRLNLTKEQFQAERRKGAAAGVAIASAKSDQQAADYRFGDFNAGAFTYLLTQYLWQETSNVESAIASIKNRIRPLSVQIPQYDVQPGSNNKNKPIYFQDQPTSPAEAVVLNVQGNEATIWMGGIEQNSLDAFGEGAILTPVIGTRGANPTQFELTSRQGLIATATIKQGSAQQGQLLQEFARAIPTDWKLGIGLDPSLGSDATTAARELQQLNRTEAIASQSARQTYADKVHYILSRMSAAYRQQLQEYGGATNIPAEGSIGLFSPALEVIPQSFGAAGEGIEAAMERLSPTLRGLLATRIIKLTLNAQSSQLGVGASISVLWRNRPITLIGQSFTPRSSNCDVPKDCKPGVSRGEKTLSQEIPLGAPFQLEIVNNEQEALYLGILAIDTSGEITVLFPNHFHELAAISDDEIKESEATRIEANSTRLIPNANDDFVLASEELGAGEILVIASQEPMVEALKRLRGLSRGRKGLFSLGERSADVMNQFISDIDTISRGTLGVKSREEYYKQVSTAKIAALSISFAVVPD